MRLVMQLCSAPQQLVSRVKNVFCRLGRSSPDDNDEHAKEEVEKIFFQVEREIEKGLSRAAVCMNGEREKGRFDTSIAHILL